MLAQLCPTLCNPMGYSLSGSSVHGILQARILSGLPFPPPVRKVTPVIYGRETTLRIVGGFRVVGGRETCNF